MIHAGIDTLLGGRVLHAQRRSGHRSGIEPVLMAASIAAHPGERVLEAGTGSGAGLLCLAARVGQLQCVGIEQDEELAEIARHNAARNHFGGIEIVTGDIADFHDATPFDHAMANPPWYVPHATSSPDPARAAARQKSEGLIAIWARALARHLRHHGTLTMFVNAASASECLAALGDAGCGSCAIMPFWPRVGREAKLVAIQAVRGGRGPTRILPGLVLHGEGQSYTTEAEAVLREAAALDFTCSSLRGTK
jgi:tRNA1Val (adenine37-N6)-methyltransferase